MRWRTRPRRWVGIDVVVNNAGIGAQGTVETNSLDEWRHVFEVNVFGMVRVMRAALPHLRRSDHAAVVNTCSIAATAGLPERALYSASKGAVLSLTLAMAADHLHEGHPCQLRQPRDRRHAVGGRLLDRADDPAAERAALEARQPSGRSGDSRRGRRGGPVPRRSGGRSDDRHVACRRRRAWPGSACAHVDDCRPKSTV